MLAVAFATLAAPAAAGQVGRRTAVRFTGRFRALTTREVAVRAGRGRIGG